MTITSAFCLCYLALVSRSGFGVGFKVSLVPIAVCILCFVSYASFLLSLLLLHALTLSCQLCFVLRVWFVALALALLRRIDGGFMSDDLT